MDEQVIQLAARFKTVTEIAIELGKLEDEIQPIIDRSKKKITDARKKILKTLRINDPAYRMMILDNVLVTAESNAEKLSALRTARQERGPIDDEDDDWLRGKLEE